MKDDETLFSFCFETSSTSASKSSVFNVLNVTMLLFSLSYQFYGEPDIYRRILDIFNIVFTFMFTGEAVLKLFAFRTVSPGKIHFENVM